LKKHINSEIKKLSAPLKYASKLINDKKMTPTQMQFAFINKYPKYSRNIY